MSNRRAMCLKPVLPLKTAGMHRNPPRLGAATALIALFWCPAAYVAAQKKGALWLIARHAIPDETRLTASSFGPEKRKGHTETGTPFPAAAPEAPQIPQITLSGRCS
jgi:hypothetical protein